VLSCY